MATIIIEEQSFPVTAEFINTSTTLSALVEEFTIPNEVPKIPCPNITVATFPLIVKLTMEIKQLVADNAVLAKKEQKKYDWSQYDKPKLFELVNAANYLAITPLIDSLCYEIAMRIKNLDASGMKQYLELPYNNLSAEEEAKIKDENAWMLEEPGNLLES